MEAVKQVSKTGPLKSCVFSEVEAVLTLNGEAVEGARIVRKGNWQSEKPDETITDTNGKFRFPAVYERNFIRLLASEFAVSQSLTVHYQGKEFVFWVNSKREVEENSELAGKDLRFRCELTNDMQVHELGVVGTMYTLCTLPE